MSHTTNERQERLCKSLDRIPLRSGISYVRLAELIGVQSAYCRVFPRVLRDAGVRTPPKGSSTSGVVKDRWGRLSIVTSEVLAKDLTWNGSGYFAGERAELSRR